MKEEQLPGRLGWCFENNKLLLNKINLLLLILKLEMRPFSQKSTRSKQHKYLFQNKLKSRISGQGLTVQNSTLDFKHQSHRNIYPIKNKHNHTECSFQVEQFNRSACKLQETNFSHHDASNCLCGQCSCGRHLCKLHVIKPDLTKATVYQKSFQLKYGKPVVVTYARQYDKLKGPHLELNTTYKDGFNQRKPDQIQRPHPEDFIHFEGPIPNVTSYSNQFPGHRGDNQYVKPTDKHFRGPIPFRSKSTYSEAYSGKTPKKDDYKYMKDQLKTGQNWFGTTSYGGFFRQPNPEYFAKPVKIIEKKEDNPDYNLQYQTTYKNHYIQKGNQQCPAKVYLQTKAKGSFSESKAKFTQNSDFKALSPSFRAISTSKHHYV